MNKKLIVVAVSIVAVGIIGFRLATHNVNKTNPIQAGNTDNLRHITMQVDGMYCSACPYTVEHALRDMPGIANVTVGFIRKEISNGKVEGVGEVIYDATQTNPDKIVQAILPYKGTVLTDEATRSTELTPISKTFGR